MGRGIASSHNQKGGTLKVDFKTETELAARILGYSFLFRSFIEGPSKDFLMEIKKTDVLIFLPYIEDEEKIKEGIELLEAYINQETPLEKLADELTIEYDSLFIGAGKPPVPPWESLWLGGERLFSLNETLEVRRHYAKRGLLPERLNKEPDDHIGFELQFMYILSEKTAKAIESGDYRDAAALIGDQRDFLKNHLLKWAPDFAERVYLNAGTDFYRGAAAILSGFLKADYARVCTLCEIFAAEEE